MKKKIGIIIGILMLATAAWAIEYLPRPTWNTASALIDSGPGVLDGFVVITDGTNSVSITLLDAATANSSTILWATMVAVTSSANRATAVSLSPPWRYMTGVYAVTSSTGTYSYAVNYRKY